MPISVTPFFDPDTFSYSYVVEAGEAAAVIDPVLNYDAAAGRTSTCGADAIIEHIGARSLTLSWILETHIHADHLSAAQHIKQALGGTTVVGAEVRQVQRIFAGVFNVGEDFAVDGRQFDKLVKEGDQLPLGEHHIEVLNTPGHTPACVTYLIGPHAFVGDTLFMPDYGTARTDFPGGDAHTLYQSIRKILALPQQTTLYMCHDYGTEQREQFEYQTTVAAQRTMNVQVNENVDEDSFVTARRARDAGLAAPRLLYPSVQFNMRAGAFPPAEGNGRTYFKIPVGAA